MKKGRCVCGADVTIHEHGVVAEHINPKTGNYCAKRRILESVVVGKVNCPGCGTEVTPYPDGTYVQHVYTIHTKGGIKYFRCRYPERKPRV